MPRPRLALLFLCALLTVELTLHNHSLIPGDGSAAALAQQQASCPACATTSGSLAPAAPQTAAPLRVSYTLATDAVLVPSFGAPIDVPARAPPQA